MNDKAKRIAKLNTEIYAMLDEIKDKLHPAIEEAVNWGHVGDTNLIHGMVKEIHNIVKKW
jgi:hypothetical protein